MNIEKSSPQHLSNSNGLDRTLIYLVRHGVTEWNRQKRFQGQLDVPLSKGGLEQANAVADWFAQQPTRFRSIYSSDLARAAQTAHVIGSRLDIEPQFSSALREIHCGEWQGLSVSEVETLYPGQLKAWDANVKSFRLPGGETVLDVQDRLSAFYRQIIEGHAHWAGMLIGPS